MKYIISHKKINVIINIKDLAVTELNFCQQSQPQTEYNFYSGGQEALYYRIHNQIAEYLDGKRNQFDINFYQSGTELENRVWQELTRIPYGTTISYSELARRCNLTNAARAVAGIVARNKILILIPCHRVIGKDGSLRGYSGGIDNKKMLLDLESAHRK